jgi:glycerophosphoryl diester phosphodiesterase
MALAGILAALGIVVSVSISAAAGENGPSRMVLDLQGHRGARGLHPENTREGFRQTLALGVTTLEMDVGMTSDGVVVVHHDEHLSPDIARVAEGQWIEPPTRSGSAAAAPSTTWRPSSVPPLPS